MMYMVTLVLGPRPGKKDRVQARYMVDAPDPLKAIERVKEYGYFEDEDILKSKVDAYPNGVRRIY